MDTGLGGTELDTEQDRCIALGFFAPQALFENAAKNPSNVMIIHFEVTGISFLDLAKRDWLKE
jgi:hypothetical protein